MKLVGDKRCSPENINLRAVAAVSRRSYHLILPSSVIVELPPEAQLRKHAIPLRYLVLVL
jgi:hypothetical protein